MSKNKDYYKIRRDIDKATEKKIEKAKKQAREIFESIKEARKIYTGESKQTSMKDFLERL